MTQLTSYGSGGSLNTAKITSEGDLQVVVTAEDPAVIGNLEAIKDNSAYTPPRAPASTALWSAGVVANGVNAYSPIFDLGAGAYARNVLAQKVSSVVAANGEELEIEWSVDGIKFYPTANSTIGSPLTSKVTATASEKTLISRGITVARYFRVRLKGASGGTNADTEVYIAWIYSI